MPDTIHSFLIKGNKQYCTQRAKKYEDSVEQMYIALPAAINKADFKQGVPSNHHLCLVRITSTFDLGELGYLYSYMQFTAAGAYRRFLYSMQMRARAWRCIFDISYYLQAVSFKGESGARVCECDMCWH